MTTKPRKNILPAHPGQNSTAIKAWRLNLFLANPAQSLSEKEWKKEENQLIHLSN